MTKTHDEIKAMFEEVAKRENGRDNGLIWTVWQNDSEENHIGCEYGYVRDGEHAIISMTELAISRLDCFKEFTHAVNVLTNLYNEISGNDEITPPALEGLGFSMTMNRDEAYIKHPSRKMEIWHNLETAKTNTYLRVHTNDGQRLISLSHVKTITQLKQLLQLLGVGGE